MYTISCVVDVDKTFRSGLTDKIIHIKEGCLVVKDVLIRLPRFISLPERFTRT